MTNPKLPEFHSSILPEWIDHNGHMNVAYYVLVFDHATDHFYDFLGIGHHYQQSGYSVFTLGMNVDYLRELLEGDQIKIVSQLLDWDHKRVHYIHHMYHLDEGYLAATNECLGINVSMESRKSIPFPADRLGVLRDIGEQHKEMEYPKQAFRQLGIRH